MDVNNNRNKTTTDVEKGNWETIDLYMDLDFKRKLVPIIAGLSLTVIGLGVFLAYLLLEESRLCQTDGKLLPPGQTTTPPPVLITQTDPVMNQSYVTTTTSHHHQDNTTIPPPPQFNHSLVG
ncbi:hypothetical protein Pcinc_022561 [Petrolisthes cinctipes]|nr:hypothetical protein Pcinc_022561 [Petrolisthes cinctipes]